jgi:hypothetical protein
MQISHRRSRLPAFGLVDALVGIFILATTVATLVYGFSTLIALGHRQDAKVDSLLEAADMDYYESWL